MTLAIALNQEVITELVKSAEFRNLKAGFKAQLYHLPLCDLGPVTWDLPTCFFHFQNGEKILIYVHIVNYNVNSYC